jgi:hypothetical protein
MSVISTIAIQVTREHPKSYKGISRVQATNTRVAISKQFQDLIEPSQDGYFRHFPPAFHGFLRAMLMNRRSA